MAAGAGDDGGDAGERGRPTFLTFISSLADAHFLSPSLPLPLPLSQFSLSHTHTHTHTRAHTCTSQGGKKGEVPASELEGWTELRKATKGMASDGPWPSPPFLTESKAMAKTTTKKEKQGFFQPTKKKGFNMDDLQPSPSVLVRSEKCSRQAPAAQQARWHAAKGLRQQQVREGDGGGGGEGGGGKEEEEMEEGEPGGQ